MPGLWSWRQGLRQHYGNTHDRLTTDDRLATAEREERTPAREGRRAELGPPAPRPTAQADAPRIDFRDRITSESLLNPTRP